MLRPVDLIRLSLAGTLLLAGCSQELYGETQDSVTGQFGDAVRGNQIAQTIDPWPADAANTRLQTKGRPMNAAMDRYYSGTILPPVAANAQSGLNGSQAAQGSGGAVASR